MRVIWGEKVGLRTLRPLDAVGLRRFMSDPEVSHLLFEETGGELPPVWMMALGIMFTAVTGRLDWAIVERSGKLVGLVRLWRISDRNRSAMLTIYIGEKSRWGLGYGTDALRLVLRQAFGPLHLNRVELHVFDYNQRAIRCYEKVGFLLEGARREALVRGHEYHDILVMGVLRDEFFARDARLP